MNSSFFNEKVCYADTNSSKDRFFCHGINPAKVIITLFLAVLLIVSSTIALADETTKNPLAIDMAIVIDNSISMNTSDGSKNKSDPNGLRFDAASILIGMCDTTYSRATYFLFADDLYLYSETQTGNVAKVSAEDLSLSNISIPANRNIRLAMINQLTGKKIRSGYGTKKNHNIGKALDAAVKLLLKDDNGNRKVILLLSDGKVKLDTDAQTEESRRMALAARETAVENNITIYTVLLKESSGGSLMQQLATSEDKYKYVASAEDLTNIFNLFYADMIGSDSVTRTDAERQADDSYVLNIRIPNNSIAEVNVIVPISEISSHTLIKNDGTPIDPVVDSALISNGNYFASYKIVKPAAGDWKLAYISNNSKTISVQYVFSYDVQVLVSSDKATYSKHEPITIKASYVSEGLPARDHLLYDIPATLRLWKNGNLVGEYPMPKNATNDGYTYTFDSLSEFGTGDFEYIVHFEGDGLLRESDRQIFTLVNDAPVLVDGTKNGGTFEKTINIPTEANTYNIASEDWDLSPFVTDINGDSISFEIKSNDAKVNPLLDKAHLKIETLKDTGTTGKVIVATKDSDGAAGPDLIFNINVVNFEDRYASYSASFRDIQGALKNSDYELELTVRDANGTIVEKDANLPDQVAVQIKDVLTNNKEDITLNRNAEGRWTGTFRTGGLETSYQIESVIPVGQKVITVQPLAVGIGNTAPQLVSGQKANQYWNIQINDPQDKASYEIKEKSWNLDEIVNDPNGDKITYKIESKPERVTASLNDNVLTVSSKLNTSAKEDIIVSCADNDGLPGPTLTFSISVVVFDEKYSEYEAKLTVDSLKKSNDATITLSVYKFGTEGGTVLETEDENLPKEITATVTQGTTELPILLVRDEDGIWKGNVSLIDSIADYSVSAILEVSRDQKIIPETLKFTTVNANPVIKKQPATVIPEAFNKDPFLIWNKVTAPVEIDLNEYFTDPDGDLLTYSVSDSSAASLKGSTLTVNGEGIKESGSFTITATDNDGASVSSDTITYKIKSLQQEGLITIGIAVAALILLLLFIHAIKPKFPNAKFSVSVNGVPYNEGQPLPKGSMAKKAVKLQAYAPTMAQSEYGHDIHTALGYVMVKPGYGNTVKIDATKANGVTVSFNGKNVRKGKLSSNGKFNISKGSKNVQFALKLIGASGAAPKKPTKSGGKSTTQTRPSTTTTSSRSGSRT